MGEPVSREDIENHPWLASWNKIDDDVKIDILRGRITELEDTLGTASVIIIVMAIFIIALVVMMIVDSGISVNPKDLMGMAKQLTGK